MTLKELKTRLTDLPLKLDNLPVRVMQEHNGIGVSGIVQYESDLTDVASCSKYIVLIGQELIQPEGETIMEKR